MSQEGSPHNPEPRADFSADRHESRTRASKSFDSQNKLSCIKHSSRFSPALNDRIDKMLSLAAGQVLLGHIDSNNKLLPCTIHVYSKADAAICIYVNFNRPASKKEYAIVSKTRKLTIASPYRTSVFARDSIRYRVEAEEPVSLIIKAEFAIGRPQPEVAESSPEPRKQTRGIDIQEYMNIQLLPPSNSARKPRAGHEHFDKHVETLLAFDKGSRQRNAVQRSSIESVCSSWCSNVAQT